MDRDKAEDLINQLDNIYVSTTRLGWSEQRLKISDVRTIKNILTELLKDVKEKENKDAKEKEDIFCESDYFGE